MINLPAKIMYITDCRDCDHYREPEAEGGAPYCKAQEVELPAISVGDKCWLSPDCSLPDATRWVAVSSGELPTVNKNGLGDEVPVISLILGIPGMETGRWHSGTTMWAHVCGTVTHWLRGMPPLPMAEEGDDGED